MITRRLFHSCATLFSVSLSALAHLGAVSHPADALPESTVGVVHVPQLQSFNESVSGSQFGTWWNAMPERMQTMMAEVEKQYPDEYAEFTLGLSQVGMTTDDILALWQTELAGFAVGFADASADLAGPQALESATRFYFWWEGDAELAEKMLNALDLGYELADEGDRPQRIDQDVAGLAARIFAADDETQLALAHHEGRILGVLAPETDNPEAATQALGEWWVNQQQGDLTWRQSATGQSMSGVPLIETIGHLSQLWTTLEGYLGDAVKVHFDRLGVTQLQAAYMRVSAEAPGMKTALGLVSPSPRSLLAEILVDGPTADRTPPPWVPADVIGSTNMSNDLGRVWAITQQILQSYNNPDMMMGLQMADMQLTALLQTNVAGILESLGSPITMYQSRLPIDRLVNNEGIVIVCPITDMDLWQRILDMARPYSNMAPPGMVNLSEQNGFTVINGSFPNPSDPELQIQADFAVGNGYLAFCLGEGLIDGVLHRLMNQPAPQDQFVNSDLYQRGATYIPDGAMMLSGVTDYSPTVDVMRQSFEEMSEEMYDVEGEWAIKLMTDLLMPESSSMFGVAGGGSYADEAGYRYELFNELP